MKLKECGKYTQGNGGFECMRKSVFLIFTVFCMICMCSCSHIMGYSVLLWNLPEHNMQDGDIVPVYIKSNISHVYVVGIESGNIEVPLWQMTEPVSKRKVAEQAKKYEEFRHVYASVALDGLPMRAEPVNTSKQVYRLRENEIIKVLFKGEGQVVMSGKSALEGDWLRVLTSDGTQGWCFSYNLRLYQTDSLGNKIGGDDEEKVENTSTEIDRLLLKIWYPENYKAMVESGRIDIEKLNPYYNMHIEEESGLLYFNMPKASKRWEYKGSVQSASGQYNLTDIPMSITVRRQNFIVVRYTGENGKPEDFNLVTLEQNIPELLEKEHARREKEYNHIIAASNSFKSESYGILNLQKDHRFKWTNNRLLVPSVIPSSAKSTGTVEVKYFLSKSLSAGYDGVLTFKFDGMQKEINFLYKMEDNGLRFEDATGAVIKNNILMERSLSPLVIFFSKM